MTTFLRKPLSVTAIGMTLLCNSANAQDITDASKYAQTIPLGTARSVGFGGALGSVGGDFGSLSVNPAGIGVYRTSEFLFTPTLRFSGNTGTYNGETMSDNNVRFGLNSIGAIFTNAASGKNYEKAKWKSSSFGFGLNRIADYSRTYAYRGQNYKNSISEYFEGDAIRYPSSADNSNESGTPAYMGYNSYLLDNNLLTNVPISNGLGQQRTVQEKGGITEMAISGGGNYMDKLMIGATMGISFLNHKTNALMYEETIDPNASNVFDYLKYTENFKITGTGINAKLGAIYRFNDYFRAGVAFHTPTIFNIKDIFNKDLVVESKSLNGLTSIVAPENLYEYRVITPYKAIVSATGMLGKYGFISLDYEFVNYASMRFRFEDDKSFEQLKNSEIKSLMQSTSNIRIGTELRFENVRVRAGYGFYGSPYKNDLLQGSRSNISFGLGYRFDNVFVDFAIINTRYTTTEQPYVLDGSLGYTQPNDATIKNSLTQGMLTVGWKFE